MKIRRLLSIYKILFLPLVISFIFSPKSWGQGTTTETNVYKEGRISEALHASMIPDNKTIGVYLTIGEDNEFSPQEWAAMVDKYFKAYGFPVKIILNKKRLDGKGAVALIYIGAVAYDNGNLSNGDVSLYYLLTEHEKVFTDLLELYKKANPALFEEGNKK